MARTGQTPEAGPPAPDWREREADERDRLADERDWLAGERERGADERGRLADERDRVAAERERLIVVLSPDVCLPGRQGIIPALPRQDQARCAKGLPWCGPPRAMGHWSDAAHRPDRRRS